ADRGRDGRTRVSDGEKVVGRFVWIGEAADRALLPQLFELPGPAGDHFVRIALVADVKEQPVWPSGVRPKVEDAMQGEGQFDHAQVGCQMPAVLADRLEDALAHLQG